MHRRLIIARTSKNLPVKIKEERKMKKSKIIWIVAIIIAVVLIALLGYTCKFIWTRLSNMPYTKLKNNALLL